MAMTAEQIETTFLDRAIKAGVAGDMSAGAKYQYEGDPRDLEMLTSSQGDERSMGEEEAEAFEDREIEGSKDPSHIVLRFKDGSTWEGDIPPLTTDRIDTLSVLQTQQQVAERKLAAAAERGDAKGIMLGKQAAFNAKKAVFKFVVPTFPDFRYRDLLMSAYVAVISRLDDMQNEMLLPTQRGNNPNR